MGGGNVRKRLRRLSGGGYAFRATGAVPEADTPKPRARARKTAEFRDPDGSKLPLYAPRLPRPRREPKVRQPKPQPPTRRVVLDPAAEVGCTSEPALSPHYAAAAWEAERRLKAGSRQGLCGVCWRWRWADEPCEVAQFVPGKSPRQQPQEPTP